MVTRPPALGFKHPAAPAERTMLKVMLSLVAARDAETKAKVRASVEKMNFVFILLLFSPFNLLVIWLSVCWDCRVSGRPGGAMSVGESLARINPVQ